MANNNEIQETLAYYFSHSNIRTDKFLLEKMNENNGWIDSNIILSFNKMKMLGADIETFFDAVKSCDDLIEFKFIETTDNKTESEKGNDNENELNNKEKPQSDGIETAPIEVSTKSTKIIECYEPENRNEWCHDFDKSKVLLIRKKITDEFLKYVKDENIDKKIVCVKGFESNSTLDEIRNFLLPHFKFTALRMIRKKDGSFFGKVVVELTDLNDLPNVLELRLEVPKFTKTEENDQYNSAKTQDDSENSNKNGLNIEAKIDENNKDIDNSNAGTGVENRLDMNEKNLSKRIKLESLPNYLQFEAQSKQNKQKTNKNQKDPLEFYKHKFYRYTSNLTEIKDIKNLVKEAAFVDTRSNILRFKTDCDFEKKSFEKDINKVQVTKLNSDEIKKYIEDNKLFEEKKRNKAPLDRKARRKAFKKNSYKK